MRIRLISCMWFWSAVTSAMYASASPMRSYTIDLPHHVLHFSLPEEISRGMSSTQVETRFAPNDAAYLRDGFRLLGGQLHDFDGPFWVGARGSLKLHIIVIKRSAEIDQEIVTLSGLERYVRQWIGKKDYASSISYSQAVMNGEAWVFRLQDTFGRPATPMEPHAEHAQIFSHPLEEDMFLEVGFRLMEWVPDSAKKWRKKAEEFREAIKATIVLEPKKQ